MAELYTNDAIISFLEQRDFQHFVFRNGRAYINSEEADEIVIEAPDGRIPDERIPTVIKVLTHFHTYIGKAHSYLEHFDLKNDPQFPRDLSQGFEIYGLYFGAFSCGDDPEPVTNADGMTITFKAAGEYFPLKITVKFIGAQQIAAEEWLDA